MNETTLAIAANLTAQRLDAAALDLTTDDNIELRMTMLVAARELREAVSRFLDECDPGPGYDARTGRA